MADSDLSFSVVEPPRKPEGQSPTIPPAGTPPDQPRASTGLLDGFLSMIAAGGQKPHPPAQTPSLLDHFMSQAVQQQAPSPQPLQPPKPPSLLDHFLSTIGETEQGAEIAHPEFGPIETTAPPAPISPVARVGKAFAEPVIEAAKIPGQVVSGEIPFEKIPEKGREFAATFGTFGSSPAKSLASGIRIGKPIEKLFSPTTVDASSLKAESDIREAAGMARRDTEAAIASVEHMRRQATPLVPPFEEWLAQGRTGPEPALMKFFDYAEGRSAGATLPPEAAHLQPLADQLRKVYQDRAAAIRAEPTTQGTSLWDDYLSHAWKEKTTARTLAEGGATKQGSGASLRERKLPTIREGIEAGLTPATPDPIEMMARYVTNMDRYLATNRVFRQGLRDGMIRFWPKGNPKNPDWVPLAGRLAGPKAAGTSGGTIQAYAPEGYARIYNNFIDPGMQASEIGGPIYRGLLAGKNATTGLLLSLSGFHALAETENVIASGMARAIGNVKAGEYDLALKNAGLSAMIAPKVAEQLVKGGAVREQYLRLADHGPDFERIASLLARSGGRAVGRGAEYRGSAMENYAKAWRRGSLALETKAGLTDIAYGGSAMGAPWRAAKMFGREVARLSDTVTAPIFDYAVPRIKNAAFHDEMADWLRANPIAGDAEQVAQARKVWDSIDDRYGEMVLDNIFWNKTLKQSLMLSTVSLGWELGTIRLMGGGALDAARFLRNGELSSRLKFAMGLPVAIGLMNSVYEYLKTGKIPLETDTPLLDLVSPRTGGQLREGVPERSIGPGYEKDYLGYWSQGFGHLGAVNPMIKMIGQAAQVARGGELKDWADHPVLPMWDAGRKGGQPKWYPDELPKLPPWVWAYTNYAMQQAAPIALQNYAKQNPGTSITPVETFMGIRRAPKWIVDPTAIAASKAKHERGEAKGARRTIRKYPQTNPMDLGR